MFNKLLTTLLAIVSFSAFSSVEMGLDYLKTAENFRLQYQSALIECGVELFESDVLVKTRLYDVYKGEDNRSVVIFKSAADAGQKVLMKDEKFWMFMPKSRRPIRITPMQKLLGEASLGDVATLNWSENYRVVSQNEAGDMLNLVIESTNGSASYQKIDLQLQKDDRFPVKADLYLKSGMLSKTAEFERGEINGESAVVKMTLIDQMRPKHKTIISYNAIKEIAIPEKLFNPQILIRSDLEQIFSE